jgi:CspA family cold shock protein
MARGTLKFFNSAKGFGFISPDDGGQDVFVHVSAVQQAGLAGIDEGDQLEYELEQDRRSGRTSAVDLVFLGHDAEAARRPAPPRFDRAPRTAGFGGPPVGSGQGVVKWFNPTKGFGFITPSEGGTDLFVHVSAVERAGLSALSEGQALAYDLEPSRNGKTSAINLRPL